MRMRKQEYMVVGMIMLALSGSCRASFTDTVTSCAARLFGALDPAPVVVENGVVAAVAGAFIRRAHLLPSLLLMFTLSDMILYRYRKQDDLTLQDYMDEWLKLMTSVAFSVAVGPVLHRINLCA